MFIRMLRLLQYRPSYGKQLSSPNPLWQREDTQLSNSCTRINRCCDEGWRKKFISHHFLNTEEKSNLERGSNARSLEKLVSMSMSEWKHHCGNILTFVFSQNRSNKNDVTNK